MRGTETVRTTQGLFIYQPEELYHGRGRIDPSQSASNLRDLKSVFEKREITFGIIYGTLLGAIREGAFISWDEDVDVFMVDEDREKLHEALWDMRSVGLELIRKDGDIYSVMKGGDYIDIYVFKQKGGRRWCNSDVLAEEFFGFREMVDFMGDRYACPMNPVRFLETVYGVDWRTPKEGYPARPWSSWRKFKRALKDNFPRIAQWYFRLRQ